MQLLEKEEWVEFGDLLMVRCELFVGLWLYYTGYKCFHAAKFQSILTLDGLISSLAGPYLGKDGDWPMYQRSSCIDRKPRDLHNYQDSDPNHQGASDSAGSGHSNLEPPKPMEHTGLYLWGNPTYQRSWGASSAYKVTLGVPVLRALMPICRPYLLVLNIASGKQ